MKAFYCDQFVLPLPEGHRFPMAKYRQLRDKVAQLRSVSLLEPPAASHAVLALAHDLHYLEEVTQGRLPPAKLREIGFPWSLAMVERSRRSTGATICAARVALEEGVAANLAGGTHHAYADHGAGFCVFNDAAVAARAMQAEGRVDHVAIIDLDVHQGNGTASILAGDSSIFTLSLHGDHNYPFHKEQSNLDVGLPDGCSDDTYLAALDEALAALFARFQPQLIIYLAGADAHEGDRLGRLKLSFAGMARRDQRVFEAAHSRRIPVAVTMAGGYGRDISNTVAVHFQTISRALDTWRLWNP